MLIVCVGNNSPIPQGMKQAWKRSGPQTSGGPPGHGTPRRTTAGTTAASTQKRAEESPKVWPPTATVQTPQGAVAASPQAPPAIDHTRADRALGPETQRPPTPQSGPSKASRARPRQATAESGPALTRASCPGARNHQRTWHPPPAGHGGGVGVDWV